MNELLCSENPPILVRNMIVIEGPDCSGKSSITQKLAEKLMSKDFPAEVIKFPNYESKFGRVITDYLNGDFPSLSCPAHIEAKIISSMYSLDRAVTFYNNLNTDSDVKNDFCNTLISKVVNPLYTVNGHKPYYIFDRYTQSNILYQIQKIRSIDLKRRIGEFIYEYEFNGLSFPLPEYIFYLVPESYDILERNMSNRKEAPDLLESETRLKSTYRFLSQRVEGDNLNPEEELTKYLLYDLPRENGSKAIEVVIKMEDTVDDVVDQIYDILAKDKGLV